MLTNAKYNFSYISGRLGNGLFAFQNILFLSIMITALTKQTKACQAISPSQQTPGKMSNIKNGVLVGVSTLTPFQQ